MLIKPVLIAPSMLQAAVKPKLGDLPSFTEASDLKLQVKFLDIPG